MKQKTELGKTGKGATVDAEVLADACFDKS